MRRGFGGGQNGRRDRAGSRFGDGGIGDLEHVVIRRGRALDGDLVADFDAGGGRRVEDIEAGRGFGALDKETLARGGFVVDAESCHDAFKLDEGFVGQFAVDEHVAKRFNGGGGEGTAVEGEFPCLVGTCVAGITETVAVGILLVGVGDFGAVVDGVFKSVAVGVFGVENGTCVVVGVAERIGVADVA